MQLERDARIHSYHLRPYTSAEFFYESQYRKWADTAIYLGCFFPIGKHVYYENQNQTGPSPNQQYNQFGWIVNLYFARRSQMDFIVVGEVPLGGVRLRWYRFEISNTFLVRL